jgi:hypothetical protein
MLNKEIKKPIKNNHCKWCRKIIPIDKAYIIFPNDAYLPAEKSCLKCYHNSGAALPMFRK